MNAAIRLRRLVLIAFAGAVLAVGGAGCRTLHREQTTNTTTVVQGEPVLGEPAPAPVADGAKR